jgi:transposase-like protein
MYYRITDAQVHALVGDGTHGRCERIQTFRCQACQATFSARRQTPLYRLKTASSRVAEVLTALAEGLDVAAATRVFGHRHATITRWVTRAGAHSMALHDCWFRNLQLPHVQLDEIRTRLRRRAHSLWLWLAIDPITKIIPALHLGTRTQDSAHALIHALHQHLVPNCIPVFASDGLNLYFYALTAHFGHWVMGMAQRTRHWQVATGLIYGQVKKTYRRRMIVRVTQCMRRRNTRGAHGSIEAPGPQWTAQHGVYRTGQVNTPAERGGAGAPYLVHGSGSPTAPGTRSVVAGLLPFRAATHSAAGSAVCGRSRGLGGSRSATGNAHQPWPLD